jgi:hypothetical protein
VKKMLRILIVSIWFLLHPVHVTLTSIEYVPEINSFKVFVRMYFDDFIRDYKLGGKEIQDKNFNTADALSISEMQDYLSGKVIIKVNEKQLSGQLKDMNLSDNELSMNMEYGVIKRPKTLSVKNLIMTGLYNDMSNMIVVKINDFEEGVKLTSDLTEQTFKIK